MERQRVYSGAPWEEKAGYCRALRAGAHIWVTGTVPLGPDGSADVPLQLPPTVAAAGAHLHVQGLLLDAGGSVVASTNTWLLRWE